MARLRALCLWPTLPFLLAGCSFQYACVKSLSLRCAAEPALVTAGEIQTVAYQEPASGGQPVRIAFDDATSAGQPARVVFDGSPCPTPCAAPCGAACCQYCRPKWGGIYPTVLTPWCCDGCVDVAALTAQLNYQLAGGVHGLLILGTIGEGEYADAAQREQVIRTTVQVACGKVPVVVGIHTADACVALAQMKQAKDLGASAVLVKYTGCPDTDFCCVLSFHQALACAPVDTQLPIFLYYYPSQTGVKFTPDQIASLLCLPNVVGIKESLLDLRHIEQQMALVCGQGKLFLSGTALNLTQFQAIGGHGAMCPEAALMPCRTVRAYTLAYECCNTAEARAIQKELFVIAPLLSSMPVSEGTARCLTMCTQDHKLPMFTGREASPAKLKAALGEVAVCMSPAVHPCLKQLGLCDKCQVALAVRKLRCLAP